MASRYPVDVGVEGFGARDSPPGSRRGREGAGKDLARGSGAWNVSAGADSRLCAPVPHVHLLSPSHVQPPRTVLFVRPSLFPGIAAGASSSSKSFAPLPSILFRKFDLFFFHAISWALVPEVHRRVFTALGQVVRVSARFPFRAYTIITCTFPVCDACGDVGDIVNRGRRCLGVPRSVSRSSCPPGMCYLPVRREPSFCDFEISLLCLCSLRVNPPPTVFLIFRIVCCPSPTLRAPFRFFFFSFLWQCYLGHSY
jgi:hypothetical protein